MRAVHWNVGGQDGDHVTSLFQQQFEILAFTETWDLAEGHRKFGKVNKYKLFTCCRSVSKHTTAGRPHGGIALYLHDNICQSDPYIKHCLPEKGILSIIIPHINTAVVVSYFSPSSAYGYRKGYLVGDPMLNLASAICDLQNEGLSIILLGDLNVLLSCRIFLLTYMTT